MEGPVREEADGTLSRAPFSLTAQAIALLRASHLERVLWWTYEILMAILALVAVWLLTLPEEGVVQLAHWGIWAVFAVDYATRLALAQDRKAFVRSHVPELIAAIPFDILRIARLARLARVLRAGVLLWRVSKEFRGVLRTNGLTYVLSTAAAFVVGASLSIWMVEPRIESLGDGIWWSIVTATTVGYGDIAPVEPLGRLIAACLMVVGIGTIGMTTGSIATYFLRDSKQGTNSEVGFIRERLESWESLSYEERRRLAAMLTGLADRS
jgi:voltage-gated potassium channel